MSNRTHQLIIDDINEHPIGHKNFGHWLVIDYPLIIANNRWLISWLPNDQSSITHWCHSSSISYVWKNIIQPFDTLRNLNLSFKNLKISLSAITKGHTYYKLGNTFSLTKWMGLNSFWSFSWRYSLVYWLIVKKL